MSVFIKETSNQDLSDLIGEESIYLRTGRSNTVAIDDKMEIHDVRAIHFCNGDGSHCEFRVYRDLDSPSDSIYVYNVEKIVVKSVYWSKKIDYDKE